VAYISLINKRYIYTTYLYSGHAIFDRSFILNQKLKITSCNFTKTFQHIIHIFYNFLEYFEQRITMSGDDRFSRPKYARLSRSKRYFAFFNLRYLEQCKVVFLSGIIVYSEQKSGYFAFCASNSLFKIRNYLADLF
jgi:hypothetical protein